MNTARKILTVTLRIMTWLLVAFSVCTVIFTVVTVLSVDKNDQSIFGFHFYIVKTDSMSLSDKNADSDIHFDAGDIVIVKSIDENTKCKLQAGDTIAFLSTNSVSYGETVTHMIREVKTNDEGKVLGYVTYGTKTGTDDEALVGPSYVVGIYVGKLPGVGRFFAFAKSTIGYVVCILLPFLLLIVYNGVNVIRLFRKHRREQMGALQAERDQIDIERAENQRMMQELLALKAQLDQKSGGITSPVEPASEVSPSKETTDET